MCTAYILVRGLSRCTLFCMPYPSKTDRQTILSAAVKELAQGGIRDLSLRNIAASLDLAPNAIYRYFSDRRALEAALANEAARQLELALRKAADGCEPVTAIREMSSAYIKFARDNRHLYEVMMSLHAPEHDANLPPKPLDVHRRAGATNSWLMPRAYGRGRVFSEQHGSVL